MTYDSCEELPLKIFIKCVVDHDYSGLSDENGVDLQALWDKIRSEYGELIRNEKTDVNNSLVILATKLRIEAQVQESAVFVLRKMYSEDCVKILKDAGNNYKFNYDHYPSYERDLDNCIKRLKRKYKEIEECEKDMLAAAGGQAVENSEVTKASYERDIAMLSKYMGFPIKKETTTVSEYAAIINLYCAEIEAQNNRDGKRKY